MFNVFNGHKPLKNLKSWGSPSLGMLPSENALVFVDNHDTQRNSGGLNYKTARNYKVKHTPVYTPSPIIFGMFNHILGRFRL